MLQSTSLRGPRARRALPLLALVVLVALAVLGARGAHAATVDQTVEKDGITYTFELDQAAHTALLHDIEDPATPTAVSVPETVEVDGETYTVTGVQFSFTNASERRTNVTALELPGTLTSIDGSFQCFSNVTELTIPGSVTQFNGSFENMDSLQTLTFAEGVREIGQGAGSMVSGCDSLTTIILPSTLEAINANSCFSNATALTTISLPDGLQFGSSTLGHFSGCTSLTSMTLPKSMTQIPMSMFFGCTSLTTVTATSPITKVGSSAFSDCTALTTIPGLGSVTQIDSYAFNECTALPGPVNLSSVTSLGAYAFSNCRELTGELDLSGLTEIPAHAFAYVTAHVTALSPNLTSIGDWGLLWTDLSAVKLPDTLQSVGDYGCYDAKLPESLTIPDSVTSLGKRAFVGTGVKEVHIGSGLEAFDASVFPEDVDTITINNSADNVSITGTLPCKPEYALPSLVAEGDTIRKGGPTLQEAVKDAGPGDVIALEKNVQLRQTLTIPEGKDVVIQATGEDRWLFSLASDNVGDLISVDEGASVRLEGSDGAQLVIFGKNNTGSAINTAGEVTLGNGSLVTRANMDDTSSGVVKVAGAGARLTVSGGSVSDNRIVSANGQTSYAGSVYVGDGARFLMTDGSISDNDANTADGADDATATGGVFLTDGAHGELAGGSITGNKSYRGAAVMLYGDEDGQSGRVVFEQSGGEISGNTTVGSDYDQPAGAVMVERNAEYHMTGGFISGNSARGGVGGGVCVVDAGLQQGNAEQNTAFVMDDGTISNNSANYGGGIYSYTNGVTLNGGEITGNRALSTGGGVYSEGNFEHYGTIHVNNALVTNNTAVQGGGLYFCASGSGVISSTQGIAILDNTAEKDETHAAAGDDVVFTKNKGDKDYLLDLSERLPGGGALTWARDGGVYLSSSGLSVHPTTNESIPRYNETEPEVVEGDDLHKGQTTSLALKAISDSKDGEQLARESARLRIENNTALRGGGIGANGGVIGGDSTVTSVRVTKIWDDAGDADRIRPNSVAVHLLNGNHEVDTLTLSAEDGWSGTFENLPTDGSYSVVEDVPEGYELSVSGSAAEGFVLTNSHTPEGPGEPEGPGNPEGPGEPENPGNPEEPGDPGEPGEPGNPDGPSEPGDSDDPKEPGAPDGPEDTDTSTDSDGPVIPETGDATFVGALLASGGGLAALAAGAALRRRSS